MKRFSLTFLLVWTLLPQPKDACAYIHEFRPRPAHLYDLDHWSAYTWGIDWELPGDENIVGASLFFDGIRNWDNNPNDLWIHLLDSARPGVTIHRDNQAREDYFAGHRGIEIEHYQNLSTQPRDLEYLFSDGEWNTLSLYLADGNFGLGFDPDCHYWNEGITLRVETIPNPIPPAALLFPTGLAALVAWRRFRRRKSS